VTERCHRDVWADDCDETSIYYVSVGGWLLGRLVRAGRINALRSSIADKEIELENCRKSKAPGWRAASIEVPVRKTSPAVRSEEVPESPQTFITADPLLPIYSYDDTPSQITEETIPASLPPVDISPIGASIPEIPPVDPTMQASSDLPDSIGGAPVTGNSEAAVLNRIAARAGEVNFDRIGRAAASEADDLKDIVGVGPFLERKLHSLGIYTYRQIANFTKEDIDKVNEIIEFFPGRIERDNWVEQSKDFYQRKYGSNS